MTIACCVLLTLAEIGANVNATDDHVAQFEVGIHGQFDQLVGYVKHVHCCLLWFYMIFYMILSIEFVS